MLFDFQNGVFKSVVRKPVYLHVAYLFMDIFITTIAYMFVSQLSFRSYQV